MPSDAAKIQSSNIDECVVCGELIARHEGWRAHIAWEKNRATGVSDSEGGGFLVGVHDECWANTDRDWLECRAAEARLEEH